MLYLASNSSSRATLLQKAHIQFTQLKVCFDESGISKDLKPELYVQKVLELKEKQFFKSALFKEIKKKYNAKNYTILFADSIVCVKNQILTKALNDDEALNMLKMQSGQNIAILSALSIYGAKQIRALSKTSLFLAKFETKDVQSYIQSKAYLGKAGAVMCEGFHKKYIQKMQGKLETALGLDIDIIKAYV